MRHDAVENRLYSIAREHGVNVLCEVFGLFAGYVNQGASYRAVKKLKKRQVLVPDFLIKPDNGATYLADVKVMGAGTSRYERRDLNGTCKAVNRRAHEVPGEYRRKARKADRKHNGTQEGQA